MVVCWSANMTESYLDTEEFREEVKKVGANSSYKYRSIFDPMHSPDVKKTNDHKNKKK
jgi:hypothetical protein